MEFYLIWFLITIVLLIYNKKNTKSIVIIFILLTLVYGCRNYGGVDDREYIQAFYDSIQGNIVYGIEKSYVIISKILGEIGFNYKSIFLLYSVVAFRFLYLVYKEVCKDNNDWMIGILGFFTFAFIPTITVMRQFTATAIVMYALILFMQKKYKKSIMYIVIASLIHVSALIAILVIPLLKIRISNLTKVCIVILSIIIGYFDFLPLILSKLLIFIPDKYTAYLNQTSKFELGLLILILIVIYIGQFFISFLKREIITYNKEIDFLEKGQMLYFTCYFISLSNGWMNRISISFLLFMPFLFKTFIWRFDKKEDKRLLYSICCIAYIGLYIFQLIQLNNSESMSELIPYIGSFDFWGNYN